MSDTETPVEKWHRLHPGVLLDGWASALTALELVRTDWAYRNGPLNLPEDYDGSYGWWL